MKNLLLFGALLCSSIALSQVPSYVPTPGLVGWYPFTGNADDQSASLNHGVNNGATLVQDRFGNNNSAYYFDGISNYISIPPSLLPSTHSSYSFAFWINPTNSTHAGETIISDRTGSSCNLNYRMFLGSSNLISQEMHLQTPWTNSLLSSTDNAAQNQWTFVVGTYNSSSQNMELWVNGISQSTASNTVWNIHSNPTIIGALDGCNLGMTAFFDGIIDDLGAWDRVLTQCEITSLYTAGTQVNVTQTGATLAADYPSAQYQWLDCDNNYAAISGETNQSFTPATSGNYALEVTVNGCADTSDCFMVDYTGIDEIFVGPKELVRVVDVIGRDTYPQKNKVLIYIYSDGSTERKLVFE